MRRTFPSIPLLFAVLCASGADLLADQRGFDAQAARGPSFLIASPTSREPVHIEPGSVPLLRQRISVDLMDVRLEDALEAIDAQAGLRLVYSAGIVPLESRVSLRADGISVAAALTEVLLDASVDVVISGEHAALVRRAPEPASQAPGRIAGRVGEKGTINPVVNAQVMVDGQTRAFTDDDGRYEVKDVEPGRHVVTVASIGYVTHTQEVEVPDGRRVQHDVWLEPAPTELAELVVTATGTRRRIELGNDITTIRADEVLAERPVTSVTDMLEGRVPGLVMQRTSGAPGDPARLRLRGASSPRLSNDPIVVVDGVRVYSELSDARGANLANSGYAAPSPLDNIDPHSIETIQVIKGPSAATMYGQDAANGVIVITTKAGRPGPARWTISAEQGETRMAGEYPELMLRWGHGLADNLPVFCPINNRTNGDASAATCVADSVKTFQLLNDPDLTVLDRGRRRGFSVGVSGGNPLITYGVNGTYREEEGLIALPAYEAERFRTERGFEPYDWMLRPQQLTQWGATSRITARLGSSANVSIMASLSRSEQQRSSLERQLGTLMSTYVDAASGSYYVPSNRPDGQILDRSGAFLLEDYYERVTASATTFRNGISLNWRPLSWLNATADAGIDVTQRADQSYLPAGFVNGQSSIGRLAAGQGTSFLTTMNLRTTAGVPLGRGFRLDLASGVNYSGKSVNDLRTTVLGLAEGTESLNGAAQIQDVRENRRDQATFGWYVEPKISHRRLWFSTGLRLDGGSTFGTRLKLPSFPKLDVSYLISDEPFFPEMLRSVFGTLRLRVAYGHAGRQPGPTDRLRLYGARESVWLDGTSVPAVFLETLGNTKLKPERTREFEGGFDADLLDDRITVGFSGYRKTTEDALVEVPVAPSVYGRGVSILQNVGVIRNSGFELAVGAEPVRSDLATLSLQFQMSRNRNVVVELGRGVEPFATEYGDGSEFRVVPGYPLFGRWARPVLGYADANGDGVLGGGEVLLGDTAVYVGATLPEYTAGLQSTLTLLRGALSVSVGLLYEDGLTQSNEVSRRLAPFSRAWNDPSASLAEQVAVFDGTSFTWMQTVNLLRFNTMSVRYHIPEAWVGRVGAEAASVAVEGSNLGLWTNYRGVDPNVNARTAGNGVADTGILPQPRAWQLRLTATF